MKLVINSLLVAILIVCKEALAFIPNVEIATLLLIIYSLNLKLNDSLMIAIVFATIENLLYGFSFYSLSYYLVWILIVLITYGLRKLLSDEYRVAFLSLFYGLCFDICFAIPYFFISFNSGIAYLLNGLLFSLVHGISNFIVALLLFKTINSAFKRTAGFY